MNKKYEMSILFEMGGEISDIAKDLKTTEGYVKWSLRRMGLLKYKKRYEESLELFERVGGKEAAYLMGVTPQCLYSQCSYARKMKKCIS